VVIDSSTLFRTNLDHPELRKLLDRSQKGELEIHISHIAWEEHRTQLLDKTRESVDALRRATAALTSPTRGNIVARGLAITAIPLPDEEELEKTSAEEMTNFAKTFKLNITPIAADHSERAWKNYFRAGAPFNRAEKREKRRMDIPDSWILEAAIDQRHHDATTYALCCDERLSLALEAHDIRCFQTVEGLFAAMDSESDEPEVAVTTDESLADALSRRRDEIIADEKKVLGYVAFLGPTSKSELWQLLASNGLEESRATAAADRLVRMQFLTETLNTFIAKQGKASDEAAQEVEREMIELVQR
jgi:transcriptional regulator of met regulon